MTQPLKENKLINNTRSQDLKIEHLVLIFLFVQAKQIKKEKYLN